MSTPPASRREDVAPKSMTLHEFMKRFDLDDETMAARIGGDITPRAVRKWKYFERTPRLPELLRIEEATYGLVPPRMFIDTRSDLVPQPPVLVSAT